MDQLVPNQPPEPALFIPQAPTPRVVPPAPAVPPIQKKPKIGKILGIIFGLIFLLASGAYAAAYFGVMTLPFTVPGVANDVIAKSLDGWYNSDQSETSSELLVAIEPRDASIPSILASTNAGANTSTTNGIGLGDADVKSSVTSLDILPENLMISGKVKSYVDSTTTNGNMEATILLEAFFGDTSIVADLELRQLDKDLYFKMNKLDGIPGANFSNAIGKWVATDITEASSFAPVADRAESEKALTEARAAVQQALTLAQKHRVFRTKQSLGKESIDGTPTRHTVHVIDPKRVVPFFEAWISERKKSGQDIAGAEDMLKELKKTDSMKAIENFSKAFSVDLWYDTTAKRIKQMRATLIIVPTDQSVKFATKQLKVAVTSTVISVNQKKTIEAPSPTVPFDSVFNDIALGVTEESLPNDAASMETRDAQRKSDLAKLYNALALYHDDKQTYPTTLEELAPTYLPVLPSDPSTKSRYGYEFCSKNYYYIKTILETTNGVYFANSMGGAGEVTGTVTCDGSNFSYFQDTSFNTGTTNAPTNTSTSPDPITSDKDADGLEDFLETLYGTSDNNPDTDGDGFNDGEEVDNGYNPNGPGKLSDL